MFFETRKEWNTDHKYGIMGEIVPSFGDCSESLEVGVKAHKWVGWHICVQFTYVP